MKVFPDIFEEAFQNKKKSNHYLCSREHIFDYQTMGGEKMIGI